MAFEKTVEARRGHIPSFQLNVRCHKSALTKRQAMSADATGDTSINKLNTSLELESKPDFTLSEAVL